MPPHRAASVAGVHAYANGWSVNAGTEVRFHVSSSEPYQLTVCRLGHDPDSPRGDEVIHEFAPRTPRLQPIHPGSYVHIGKNLKTPLAALTLECWVRSWRPGAWSGLITQHNYPEKCGIGLFIKPDGAVAFYLGDGADYRDGDMHSSKAGLLKKERWHHVVAVWDGREKTLWVDGKQSGAWPFAGPVNPGNAPLRLGSYGENGAADHFLDGDLAMPVVYGRALLPNEIQQRFVERGLIPAQGSSVLACWPFSEERGDQTRDVSGQGRHGRIINHATWMIGGPSFHADVPRFADYDPGKDAQRGHGLRFAHDDLYDCRWEVTHRFRVPAGSPPGLYVGRIHYELDGVPHLYHVTFIVKRPSRAKRSPILVLAATNTWQAYSGTPFAAGSPSLEQVWSTRGFKNSPGNPPAFNLYGPHAAGQGTYQMGLNMPRPAAGPYVHYGRGTGYSHLARADRFLHIWLEKEGYDFDVVSDLDLHRDPGLLRGRKVVVINGHNEYWSIPMYEGVRDFLRRGGNVLCMSGNSICWRVSFDESCLVMECRKVDAPGSQVPASRRGEAWHSQDGRRGGLMRECGYPGVELIGLDIIGWNNPSDPEQFGAYVVEQSDHFLFNHPEQLGLKAGDKIGEAPGGGFPRANGHEVDISIATFKAMQQEATPPGAGLPADAVGMLRLANGVIPWDAGGSAFDYFFRRIKPATTQGGEMIYWQRPEGGRVFNTASIATGWALLVDPKLQGLIRNVLAHFDAPPVSKG